MVLVRALVKHARISARKVRPFADLVRGKSVQEGLETLKYLPNRGARMVEQVVNLAAQLLTWREEDLPVQRQAQLQLGLQEALVNAVRHGNGCDPANCLRVRRIVTPRWLVWQVQDEGPGVPPGPARRQSLPEQREALSGRGLFLIHHCFDDVRWSPRGNRLQLAARRV